VNPDDPGSEDEGDPSYLNDDMPPLSNRFKFTMNVQLALIVLLAVFWLYEQGGGGH
jgi:hypothetical protein